MPLYEYRCDTCGKTTEHILPVEQRDCMKYCEKCKEESVKRIPSDGIRWILKGEGYMRDGGAMRKTRGES